VERVLIGEKEKVLGGVVDVRVRTGEKDKLLDSGGFDDSSGSGRA